MGRSRGGLTTKLHLCADDKARPLSLVLSEGQRSDSKYLAATLDAVRVPRIGQGRPRKQADKLRADKGCSYPACRTLLRRRGQKHLIPERRDQREQRRKKGQKGGCSVVLVLSDYAKRNVVERCILRLKQWRRAAARYEKRESNDLAMATLAAIILWLRGYSSDTL